MKTIDSLKTADHVTVTVWSPENTRLYRSTGTGFRSIEAAIKDTLEHASLTVNPEDCVFEVANQQTGVIHRYRINAHGNLKLIV